MAIGAKAGEEALAVGERIGLFRGLEKFLRRPLNALSDAAQSGSQALRRGLRSSLDRLGRGWSHDTRVLTRDPIDVASGEVVLRQVDVSLDGVLPLVFERTHLSFYTHGRLFGPSWASTLDQHLEIDDEGVCLAAEDGMVLAFPPPPLGKSVRPERGEPRLLSRNAEGGYTITDRRTGRTWHFAARDTGARVLPLAAITDRNGNRVDVHYDQTGAPVELRHSGGYRIGVDVADGRVRALRLRADEPTDDIELVRYGYDEAGRLIEVIDSSGEPLRLSYDDQGRLTEWFDRNGHWYRYEYDELGRGVRGTGSGGYLDATLTYDTANRVTTVTDSLGHATVYHLNSAGRVVAEIDPLGHETRREWDLQDRLLAETDPLGRTTRYHYDSAGDLSAIVRPDGHQVTAAYNALGLPVEVLQADGGRWRYAYDDTGNLIGATDPAGTATWYTYDGHGAVTSVTDGLGGITRLRPNAAGLPVEVTDVTGATSRFERDAFGRVVTAIDPLGGRTRTRWTVEGRPIERILPGGAAERWAYDAEGNEIEHVDAAGRVTRTEYANFDVPVARTTPEGGRLEFVLDSELRVVAVNNPTGLAWRYEYDAAGRLLRETDFDDRPITYAHDAAGRLVEWTNGAGQVTRYTRDALGDVIRQSSGDQVTTFTRDLAGRLMRAVNSDADVRFERDPVGRVVAEVHNGRVLSSGYDALGRRVSRRTPTGAESAWHYDAAGRPTALRTGGHVLRFSYDLAGRETRRHIGTGAILDQRWDADHRLITQTLWGAPVAGAGPAATPAGAEQARLLQHRGYAYRLDGHVTAIADHLSGDRRFDLDPAGRITAVHARGWTERYAYDGMGNLTHASWPVSVSDAVDPTGERAYDRALVRRAGRVHYEHDGQGRIVARRLRTLSGKHLTWYYEWDADDRLIALTTPAGQRWRYRYDAFGRRVAKQRLNRDGGTLAEQVDFVWDGAVLAEQTHTRWRPDGPVARTTTWNHEPDTFWPLSQTERAPLREAPQEWVDRQFHAIVTDLTGSATEMVSPTGEVTWHPTTTLWGDTLGSIGAENDCALRFPGQYHDAESGLNYNFHRYYDPVTARYQSPDPLGLAPQSNPYSYPANPVIWSDPLGLAPYDAGARRILNMGSGRNPMSGAVNMDMKAGPGVDVVAKAENLPFKSGTFDEVHAVNPYKYQPVTAETARVMKPGGTLSVTGSPKNKYIRVPGNLDELGLRLDYDGPMIDAHAFGEQAYSDGRLLSTTENHVTRIYRKV